MVRSGNSTSNGGLLFVVGQTLPREVCAATLRDLKNDRRLDITAFRSDMREGLLERDALTGQLRVPHWR